MENSTLPSSQHSENSAREKLSSYLGNQMKVVISDGRVLIGEFMCTDQERNLILGNCDEYIPMNVVQSMDEDMGLNNKQEGLSRMLSLAIIPGRHISSIAVAKGKSSNEPLTDPSSLKHQNQYGNQHEDQHESQHENQHEDQHESQQQDKYEGHGNQHKNEQKIQDENQHESQYENQNQHTDQNRSQHENQHNENQHIKEHESEGTKNTTDVCTEEHGQTEDFHTPQKHLTLQ